MKGWCALVARSGPSFHGYQWQQSDACTTTVNCEQSARLQLGLHVTQCRSDLRSDYLWADIFGPYLDNAWFFAMRCRKDRAEVQVKRQHDIIVLCCVSHDFRVGCTDFTDR